MIAALFIYAPALLHFACYGLTALVVVSDYKRERLRQ